MADWLETEMAQAVASIRQAHLDRLAAVGCPTRPFARLAARYTPIGVLRVQRRSGGLYEPDEAGTPAAIVPVCWPQHHAGLFGDPITLWPIIDLIAFRLNRPASWLWRCGVGWALGGHLVDDWQGAPLRVVATPLDWLRCGGDALCVLDWTDDSPAWPLLRHQPEIVATDELLARKLAQAIDHTSPRPDISVQPLGEVQAHAA